MIRFFQRLAHFFNYRPGRLQISLSMQEATTIERLINRYTHQYSTYKFELQKWFKDDLQGIRERKFLNGTEAFNLEIQAIEIIVEMAITDLKAEVHGDMLKDLAKADMDLIEHILKRFIDTYKRELPINES